MRLKRWEKLPEFMQNEEVRPYYELLSQKRLSLFLKRSFDVFASLILIVCLMPIMLVLGIWIKIDSKGPAIFKQKRVTQYGKMFNIWKFRTMVVDAEAKGNAVTTLGDPRITHVGAKLRRCRLDELPQLFNILCGHMSFVGARPETLRYVQHYSNQMYATLLLPAGVTSRASIQFKDEDRMLTKSKDVDKVYVEEILPQKMAFNLTYLQEYSFREDIKLMIDTLKAVIKREEKMIPQTEKL